MELLFSSHSLVDGYTLYLNHHPAPPDIYFDSKLVLFFAFVVIVLTKNPLVRRLNLEF